VATIVGMHDLQVTRTRALVGAALLVAALFVAGRFFVGSGTATVDRPPAAAGEIEAAAPPRLVVHVVGAVRRPGLYRLVHGARIADAVRRAGGATRRADLSLVNLAAQVSDGSQVVVPRREVVESGAASESGESGVGGAPGGPVHLNTATIDDLDAIPGIGPARLEQLRELVAP
jgi:competence protein ComEA